jgi:hypothetical protein
MGGFDTVCVYLGRWVLGFLGRSPNGFWMILVIGIKWGVLFGLGN